MPDLVSPVSVRGVDQNMTINLLSELLLKNLQGRVIILVHAYLLTIYYIM